MKDSKSKKHLYFSFLLLFSLS